VSSHTTGDVGDQPPPYLSGHPPWCPGLRLSQAGIIFGPNHNVHTFQAQGYH